MRIEVGGVRLFFDVDGPKLVADRPWMRERPTVVLLHPGPGFDHGVFRVGAGAWLASRAQVVYLDQRGAGRSDHGESGDRGWSAGRRTCASSATRSGSSVRSCSGSGSAPR